MRTDQDLYTVISVGSAAIHRFSEMPAWKYFLYHEHILDIIAYMRTLHRPSAAPRQPEDPACYSRHTSPSRCFGLLARNPWT